MKNKKFIAYEGIEYTIEWYFDEKGKSQAKQYYENLAIDKKNKIMRLFEKIANLKIFFNKEKFRHEGDQIYAFKSDQDRFLSFFQE